MRRVLVVGGGGREHAIVDALARSSGELEILATPGNPGISEQAESIALGTSDVSSIVDLAVSRVVDLVVVGPEAPLVAGLADALVARGIPAFGPSMAAARLEGSKRFAKSVMDATGVPTARWKAFDDAESAIRFACSLERGAVVKADGLAAGKGVVVARDAEEATSAIRTMLDGSLGAAGRTLVIEERLVGDELSVIAVSDGRRLAILSPARDHKRIGDGDLGPNTGGMGAYSPVHVATPALLDDIASRCVAPIVDWMAQNGTPFRGALYAGLMLTSDGPRVLEYNVRFGDPETQAILPRLEEDAFELFASAARGALFTTDVRFSSRAAATVVLAAEGYPGPVARGDIIEGIHAAADVPNVRIYHAGTSLDGDRLVTAGGRILGVTGLGDTVRDAVGTAYRAVSKISWRGMRYRRDIGASDSERA